MSSESDNSLGHIISPGSPQAADNAPAQGSSRPEAAGAPAPAAPEAAAAPQEAAAPSTGHAAAHSASRAEPPQEPAREEARALAIVLEPSERLGAKHVEGPHFLRRFGPAAAVVTAFSAVAVLALAGPLSAPPDPATAALKKPAAAAAAPLPPQRDPKLEATEMAGEIRSLSMGLATLRAKLEVMRANSETMAATLEAVRTGLDRNHPGEDARALKKSLDALREALDQVKAEQSTALTQIAQRFDRLEHDPSLKSAPIADRLDRLEHDQETRLASLVERLDRLEHRANIAQDVTGSIRPSLPPPTPANHGDPVAPPTTTARAEPASPPSPPVIPGLYVRDAEGNAALIRGPGGLFEITRGDFIQGVGRVEAIERRGRGWVVVTSRGIIESERR